MGSTFYKIKNYQDQSGYWRSFPRNSSAEKQDARTCSVMVDDEKVVGYAVVDYSFFEQGFILVLYIHPDYRREAQAYG